MTEDYFWGEYRRSKRTNIMVPRNDSAVFSVRFLPASLFLLKFSLVGLIFLVFSVHAFRRNFGESRCHVPKTLRGRMLPGFFPLFRRLAWLTRYRSPRVAFVAFQLRIRSSYCVVSDFRYYTTAATTTTTVVS